MKHLLLLSLLLFSSTWAMSKTHSSWVSVSATSVMGSARHSLKSKLLWVDPNELVKESTLPPFHCDDEEDTKISQDTKSTGACSILNAKNGGDINKFIACFDSIKEKLKITKASSPYETISKLYKLPPQEQTFMAMVLTMYGEARGTNPPGENMAAVMKVIENRTVFARKKSPQANELDVVLQTSQFSMYNPHDDNWSLAINSSGAQIASAIKVFANRNTTYNTDRMPDNIYHYHVPGIKKQVWMNVKNRVKVVLNGKVIADEGDDPKYKSEHYFYEDVSWSFNINNPYRKYAKKKGFV